MSIVGLIPVQYRLLVMGLVVVTLMALAAGGAAHFQAYRYGEQLQRQGRGFEGELAQRDKLHADALAEIQRATVTQERREREKRLQLEADLQTDSVINHRMLMDAQTTSARLRDRLATADLRLSVLLANSGTNRHCEMLASASAGRLVHGAPRSELNPAHAQRIVSITSDGDQGLIALAACQAYVHMVSNQFAQDENLLFVK